MGKRRSYGRVQEKERDPKRTPVFKGRYPIYVAVVFELFSNDLIILFLQRYCFFN